MPDIDDDIAKKYDLRTKAGKSDAIKEQIEKNEKTNGANSFLGFFIAVIIAWICGDTLLDYAYYYL